MLNCLRTVASYVCCCCYSYNPHSDSAQYSVVHGSRKFSTVSSLHSFNDDTNNNPELDDELQMTAFSSTHHPSSLSFRTNDTVIQIGPLSASHSQNPSSLASDEISEFSAHSATDSDSVSEAEIHQIWSEIYHEPLDTLTTNTNHTDSIPASLEFSVSDLQVAEDDFDLQKFQKKVDQIVAQHHNKQNQNHSQSAANKSSTGSHVHSTTEKKHKKKSKKTSKSHSAQHDTVTSKLLPILPAPVSPFASPHTNAHTPNNHAANSLPSPNASIFTSSMNRSSSAAVSLPVTLSALNSRMKQQKKIIPVIQGVSADGQSDNQTQTASQMSPLSARSPYQFTSPKPEKIATFSTAISSSTPIATSTSAATPFSTPVLTSLSNISPPLPSGLISAATFRTFLSSLDSSSLTYPQVFSFLLTSTRTFQGSLIRDYAQSSLQSYRTRITARDHYRKQNASKHPKKSPNSPQQLDPELPGEVFQLLQFLIDFLSEIEVNAAKSELILRFKFKNNASSHILELPTPKTYVLNSKNKDDPYLVCSGNQAVIAEVEVRKLQFNSTVVLQLDKKSGQIIHVRDGDLTLKKSFLTFTADLRFEQKKNMVDYDSANRFYLECDVFGEPMIVNNHYMPKRYDDWMVVTVLKQEVFIGLPKLQ